MTALTITPFFEEQTFTVCYVVADKKNKQCAIIDPVLDFDFSSATIATTFADKIITFINEQQWQCQWILETHAHADHLTAAPYLQENLGGKIVIGAEITQVQKTFKTVFNFGHHFKVNGLQFDKLVDENDSLALGDLTITVLHTPGHTPACVTYLIEDAAFMGDTLFMPDYGTARCDFPGGDAETLYQSIQKIFQLPDETRLFTGHDYKSPTRNEFAWQSTVAEQKTTNIQLNRNTSKEDFVNFRNERDSTLAVPKLLLPAVQVNINAGYLPTPENNGKHYLKLPVNTVGK
ncbi:MAG: MBL fold metallo-hydrolase [Gammaproteobacteria bacterium]|nr:MAG: MBL fold metallo-hydrolase [Gammaproteobacteria bacterium]